jgi:hypothetical protein
MKEYVELITDSFTDYAGKTHQFVIAALSQALPTQSNQLENNPVEENRPVSYEIGEYIEDYGTETYLGTVNKVVRLGVSICNPSDTFDEKVGALKAAARAHDAEPSLYGSTSGAINVKVVRALLEQEAEYLKHNPENFIPGYADMKERYLTRQKMKNLEESFTPVEKEVVKNLQENPHFLDNAMQYLSWLHNQNKGNKCQG